MEIDQGSRSLFGPSTGRGGPSSLLASRSYIGALEGPKSLTPSVKQPWIPVGEHDITTDISNGIHSLSLSKEFKDKLCQPWTNTLVVRLLGKRIGYSYLCHRLRSMWRPNNPIHIIDLDKGCFMVKFGAEQDYFKALTGGPWMILDHYLVVHQWSPEFRVSDSLPAKMVVWVRLPLMPIQYYHAQVLTSLGNLLGRTVKIDYNTQHAERGKFARMAVEIDLNQPLAPVIKLDGVWQDVEYENLPALCFTCGKVGHLLDDCPSSRPSHSSTAIVVPNQPAGSSESSVRPPLPSPDNFGPWMVVARKSRRSRKETNGQGKSDDSAKSSVERNGKKVDNIILGKAVPHFAANGQGKSADSEANFKGINGDSYTATGELNKERGLANGSDKAQIVQTGHGPEFTTSPSVKAKNKEPTTETVKKTPNRPNSSKTTAKASTKPLTRQMEPAIDPDSILRFESPVPIATLDSPLTLSTSLFPIPPPPVNQEPCQPKNHRRENPQTKSFPIPPSAKPKKTARKKDFFDDGVKKNLKVWLPPTPPAPMDLAVDLSTFLPIEEVEATTCTEMLTVLDVHDEQSPNEKPVWDLNSPSEN
ncbi:hypothetical protein LINPERPRIM_LOCUS10068 [Linum perenne]